MLEVVIAAVQIVVGFVAMVAVPWAFKTTRELGEIRTMLEARAYLVPAVDELKKEVTSIKVRLARMGNGK